MHSDLIGRTFVSKKGISCLVKEVSGNTVLFENGSSIDAKYVTDTKYFKEDMNNSPRDAFRPSNNDDVIDPSTFFNPNAIRGAFVQAVSKLSPEELRRIEEKEAAYGQTYNQPQSYNQPAYNQPPSYMPPIDNSNTLRSVNLDEQKAELARKYSMPVQPNTSSINNLMQYADAEDLKDLPIAQQPWVAPAVNAPVIPQNVPAHVLQAQTQLQNNNYAQNNIQANVRNTDNPVISLFANAKRNTKFSITLQFDTKFPNVDFIKLMEESYNESIIEYLASEFTNNILSNPSIIRDKIINELKNTISGAKKISGIAKINKKPKIKKEDNKIDETELVIDDVSNSNIEEDVTND